MANLTLRVHIVSPKEDKFDGEALSVSSKNSAGKFDILPQHANFVTLVEDQEIVILKADHTKVKFKFPLAIFHVSSDVVTIFTQISGTEK